MRINFSDQRSVAVNFQLIIIMDPRYEVLARNLVSHSTNLQPNEMVLLHAFDIPEKMTIALIRAVRERNAIPFVQVQSALLDRDAFSWHGRAVCCFCSLGDGKNAENGCISLPFVSRNVFENSDLPPEDMKLAMKSMKPVLDWRVKRPNGVYCVGPHRRWLNRLK